MHCKTIDEARTFCEYLHEEGLHWYSGRSYNKTDYFDHYGSKTLYYFLSGTYGKMEDVGTNTTILEFEDFAWGDEIPEEITMSFDSIFR